MGEAQRVGSAPTDDERMRAAVDLAGARPSGTSAAVLENHKVNMTGRLLFVVIAAAVIGGFIGFLLGGSRPDRNGGASVPGWQIALGWTLWTVGVAGCVVATVRMVRSGAFRRGRATPLRVLTVDQRKSLLRQVQGKEPVVTSQLPVTRLLATNLVLAAGNARTSVSVVAVLAGNAIRSDDAGPWYLVGLLALLMVTGAAFGRGQTGRARSFLATHPAATDRMVP